MLPKKNKSNEGDGDFESYVRNTLVGIQVDITEIKESQKRHQKTHRRRQQSKGGK